MSFTDMTVQQRLRYIRGVQLPPPHKLSRIDPVEIGDDTDGAVGASSLVSFVGDLSVENKQDVMNSTLFAELAANNLFDRKTQLNQWYARYLEVLNIVGWLTSGYQSSSIEDARSKGSVDNVVFAILGAVLSGSELELFKQTVEGMKNSERGTTIFDKSSYGTTLNDFRLGVCVEDRGNVIFQVFYFDYATSGTITNVLWFQFTSDRVTFNEGRQRMELNVQLYDQVRDTVLQRLGQNAKDEIEGIEI